jgi:glycosyltransferase involved in cell wall biosynthesis
MKIGITTSVSQRGKTGIAQYLSGLLGALALRADEHDFFLFVLEEDLPLFQQVAGSMRLIPVAEKHRPPLRDIAWHQFELPRLVRRLKLDVLHVPSYRRLLWPRPCAVVGTIHDLAPFHLREKYDWKRSFYGRVVARRLARRQDQIIAVSEFTARDISKYFRVPAERITVAPNGIDHHRFFPGSSASAREGLYRKHGIDGPYFLYVARLEHPAKNHVRLIEAFSRFKAETGSNWKLVFGGSDWHGAERIHQAIKESNHAQDIHALGFVANEDLPNLYRAAEVFVYPSLHEGFGLPPIEAMACGCPVLCSPAGALAEIVSGAAELIDPQNVSAMTKALGGLAQNSDRRQKLRELGITRAGEFTWGRAAEITLEVYKRALDFSRAKRTGIEKKAGMSLAPKIEANEAREQIF